MHSLHERSSHDSIATTAVLPNASRSAYEIPLLFNSHYVLLKKKKKDTTVPVKKTNQAIVLLIFCDVPASLPLVTSGLVPQHPVSFPCS